MHNPDMTEIFVKDCYLRSKCKITVHCKSFLTLVNRNKKLQ